MTRVGIALLIAAMPAAGLAQGETLDPHYVETVGGSYSLDCDDPDADRLTVLADRLIFSGGDEEIVATGVLSSVSAYGRNPPPGFEVALLGGEGRDGLLFEVFSDESGTYILADGYPEHFGSDAPASDDEFRFYRCEAGSD